MLTFILLETIQREPLWHGILESLIYSLIGIALAVFTYKIVDWVTPGNLSKQIALEGNVALAILVGSLMIGVCIIIAAAMN
jgi:uncharacterized membrane protein YjfL (UPF0719 family)